jgi:hypothetical protein
MTNEQKLTALREGQIGSYNLAPSDSSMPELAAFQALAREALQLAAEHGYFVRREVEHYEGGQFVSGVLVTVAHDPSAPSRLPGPVRRWFAAGEGDHLEPGSPDAHQRP